VTFAANAGTAAGDAPNIPAGPNPPSALADRARVLSFETQDYTGRQHGDARIDCYVTEPAQGVSDSTGLLLLIHGWGNDGSVAYRHESADFASRFDLVAVRVEYRHSGREAHQPTPGRTFDVPYDFSKLQTIDCLRAAAAALRAYPGLDRRRLLLWGGSQGAHLAAQCLVFCPTLWAGAVLCCGLYHPWTFAEQQSGGYTWDLKLRPGVGFVEYALGPGNSFSEAEVQIRSPLMNAALIPADVPVTLVHGTADDNVDIRHSVEFFARLLALGKRARFFAIAGGNHGLAGAEAPNERTRAAATFKYAAGLLAGARLDSGVWPTTPTTIPVAGGAYEVRFPLDGPTLQFAAGGPAPGRTARD
jgi:predicted esterase